MNIVSAYLTTQFGIHSPSRRGWAILGLARGIYASAHAELLEPGRERNQQFKQDEGRALKTLRRWLDLAAKRGI
ncbi:MAG: hypothetical protein HPY52_13990 [Firmicutes bacterium]|nr:hypothetical protein [Bacillota bacterium]